MKQLFSLLFGLLIVLNLFSQNATTNLEKARLQLDQRGEVYFRFNAIKPDDATILTNTISIDNVKGSLVFAYANHKEFDNFLKHNIDFEVLAVPSEHETVNMTDDPRQVLTWNYYPTYPAYESIMAQFVTDHPDICRLITIGTLASGRKLLALKITDNPDVQENEPEFLYTSSIHGDETTGYVLMLHLIDYLLSNYGIDQRITDMVNNMEIYINPLANPDGTYHGGNNSVNGATRYNANNVDLNRNYPDPQAGSHPDGNAWQPETVAFMNFAVLHHFTMSANFHGGEEVVNYPWDTWSRLTADNAWWVYVSREYADTVHVNAPATYMSNYNNGITNGYAWYTITGGRQDYMNYFRNCREVTVEISATKLLPTNQLLNHWNYNYRSFLNFLEESTYGINGLVTDSMSGQPLNARVFIFGHDIDSSQVNTDPAVGDYHRLLKAGLYNVTFSSAGYISKTFPVQVADHQKLILNVPLYDGRLASNFTSDTSMIPVGATVHFADRSAGYPQTWHWEFEGGTPSVSSEANPVVTYSQPGKYAVKLVVTRPGSIDSVIRQDYIDVKQWYLMVNQSYTVCDALFFDSGGPGNSYSNDESSIITFLPAEPTKRMKATFISFDIESGVDCPNDWLKVYDGTNTSSTLMGTFCGSTLPPAFLSTNSEGALTFEFHSNSSVNAPGWEAMLECDSNVGIEKTTANPFRIFPNPVTNGYLKIEAKSSISSFILIDATGKELFQYRPQAVSTTFPCQVSDGMYFIRIQVNGNYYTQKVIVRNPK